MKQLLLLAAVAAFLPLAGCNPPQSASVDFDDNPFNVRDAAVMLVSEFGDGAEFDTQPKRETIQFEDVPAPQPDPAPDWDTRLSTAFDQFNKVVRDDDAAQEQRFQKLETNFDGTNDKLDRVLSELAEIKRRQLTREDVGEVVEEKLEAFKQVLIEWQDKHGKLSTAVVPVQPDGSGSATLPPGAVVVAMGGIPLEQWRIENPDAVIGPATSSGGSNGSVSSPGGSSGSVNTPRVQYTQPMTSSPWQSDPQPMYYEAPGQFATGVTQYPDSTQVDVQVASPYLGDSGQCYTDPSTGQRVCPNASQPAASPRVGLFKRLRNR